MVKRKIKTDHRIFAPEEFDKVCGGAVLIELNRPKAAEPKFQVHFNGKYFAMNKVSDLKMCIQNELGSTELCRMLCKTRPPRGD